MRRMRENNLEVKEVVRYESNEIKKDKVNDEKSTEIDKNIKRMYDDLFADDYIEVK